MECNLIPMTDDTVSTKLKTDDGSLLDFQEYFVEKKAKPKLTEVVYSGAEKAKVSIRNIRREANDNLKKYLLAESKCPFWNN